MGVTMLFRRSRILVDCVEVLEGGNDLECFGEAVKVPEFDSSVGEEVEQHSKQLSSKHF